MRYHWFWARLDMFDQAHEQDISPRSNPLMIKLLFGMDANLIVW